MVALLVVLTFIVFIVVSSLLQKKEIEDSIEDLAVTPQRNSLPFPRGYFFSPNHTWLSLESSGNLTIGIDNLIQRFLGKVNSIQLKHGGDYIIRGEDLIVLNMGGKTIRIASPISGKIECSNFEINQNPQKIVEDPYQDCWMYLVKPTHLSDDIKSFRIAEKAKTWMSNEFSRLKDFVQAHPLQPALANSTLSDGGTLEQGIANHLDNNAIKEFEQQFLMTIDEDR